jgi:iron-only hydrogenase group A
MDKPLGGAVCINCGQCVNRCPTGALQAVDQTEDIWAAIDDPKKHVVIQTAPAPRAAIGECFRMEPGQALTFEMNTALRECGFDGVFDTNFTADLTIMEEGTELLIRLYKALVAKDASVALPQLTSCSPGWVKYLEHFYPEYIPNVSTAKSPQQMFGAVFKTYYAQQKGIDPKDIVSVSLMPCSAKKFECSRPEFNDSGFQDVDFALTTRELAKMCKEAGIDLPKMAKSDFDDPFGTATGSGVIFAATGGVMEAALRTVIELVTGEPVEKFFSHADIQPVRGMEGVRKAEVTIPKTGPVQDILKNIVPSWDWLKGATLKVAVAHGTANAKKVMENIKAGGELASFHFIEFMGCPGGCIGGGGQPIPTSLAIREARARAIYSEDNAYAIRKSHENPAVLKLYSEFLTEGPCGHLSHKLLHTSYTERGKVTI